MSAIVDLSLPPEDRFLLVIESREHELKKFASEWNDVLTRQFGVLGRFAYPIVKPFTRWLPLPEENRRELQGIARRTGKFDLCYDKLVLLNVALDILSTCTSAVLDFPSGDGDDPENVPKVPKLHLRNLDWELPDIRPLVVEMTFTHGSDVSFKAVGFAGCIGVLTGVKKEAFSISYNFRKSPKATGFIDRFRRLTEEIYRDSWASLSVRNILVNCGTFSFATETARRVPICDC